jgi:hypothetical protein
VPVPAPARDEHAGPRVPVCVVRGGKADDDGGGAVQVTTKATCIEFARRHKLNVEDVLHDWGERAGILEYDAGMSREDAEVAAMLYVMERWAK